MRALILAGLGLTLACLVVPSWADELQWRPAGDAAPAASGKPTVDPSLLRTSFQTGADTVFFRSKTEDGKPLSLPGDPASVPIVETTQPTPQKQEQMPTPKPLPPGPGPCTVITVPPGMVPPGANIVGSADGVLDPNCICGPDCQQCPDWSCCSTHRWHWYDCSCCCCCDGECSLPRIYARAEFLVWTLSRDHSPVLATATKLTPEQLVALGNTAGFVPGALGSVGTIPVLGGDLNSPTLAGGRFTVGFGDVWHCGLGVEATYFFLGQRTSRSVVSSDNTGQPGLYSPFFTPEGNPNALIVAFPTLLQGTIQVDHTSRLWGLEANARKALVCDCNQKLDVLAGFRFIELSENLSITRSNLCIQPGCVDVTSVVFDQFGTRNRFYGGQAGLDYEYRLNNWILGATGKVAIGDMHEVVNVSGFTAASPQANVQPSGVGLLAQGSNIGRHFHNHFAVVPEVGLKVGYQINDNLTVFAGYDVLYLSSVVRPGEQVDLVVDKSGNLQRPHVSMNNTSFWAHGLNAGLEWKY
jgi:hypothetical protein